MTLTPSRLAEIEALAKKATPGPWQDKYGEYRPSNECAEIIGNVDCDAYDDGRPRPIYTEVCSIADNDDRDANAAYIAALDPPTVLALLASHAALAAEVERLKAALEAYGLHAADLALLGAGFLRITHVDPADIAIGKDGKPFESALTTARASAAREMRTCCRDLARIRGHDALADAISALPLTPETTDETRD